MSRTKMVQIRKLILETVRDYRNNWWAFSRIVLLIQIPVGLLSLSLADDDAFGAYSSIVTVILNMALIFTINEYMQGNKYTSFKQAFYIGTARFVPFVLVALMLVVALVPALMGVAVYSLSTFNQEGMTAPLGQQLLGGLVGLILAIPSFWLLTRWIFAPYAVMLDELNPVAAIKASRELSIGRFWRVLNRVVMLLVMITLVAVLIAIPTLLIGQLAGVITVVLAAFQVISTCIVLPLVHIYILKLYRSLNADIA